MRFKAEIFDKLQFLFESYKFNDHVLHCIINFNGKINIPLLKRALIITLKVAPILKSRYIEDIKEPYWEEIMDINLDNIITVVNTNGEFHEFIVSKIDETKGPQIKTCLLDLYNKHTLAILINHMICDAAGFKKYLYILCDIYSNLLTNDEYCPNFTLNGSRSIQIINDEFNFIHKIRTFISQRKESNGIINLKFPMSSEKSFNAFILTHTIDANRFKRIKAYCKVHSFTLNDVLLAAYYRVLYKTFNENKLSISVAVDMRKHLKSKDVNSLCNLTSTVISIINYESNDTFYDTSKKVNENMTLKKINSIGLNGFVKISLLFKLFSYTRLKKLLSSHFNNPLIGMTNIGILNHEKLCFNGTEIENAFMCGSIKYKPYFQLAVTTYNKTMTLSINLYGTKEDKRNIENFFTLFDNELPV
ncbi:siderophore synthetase [Clostridium acetobutylicum]|nr:siderophore synthetase [Clostridium acetobutylicum]